MSNNYGLMYYKQLVNSESFFFVIICCLVLFISIDEEPFFDFTDLNIFCLGFLICSIFVIIVDSLYKINYGYAANKDRVIYFYALVWVLSLILYAYIVYLVFFGHSEVALLSSLVEAIVVSWCSNETSITSLCCQLMLLLSSWYILKTINNYRSVVFTQFLNKLYYYFIVIVFLVFIILCLFNTGFTLKNRSLTAKTQNNFVKSTQSYDVKYVIENGFEQHQIHNDVISSTFYDIFIFLNYFLIILCLLTYFILFSINLQFTISRMINKSQTSFEIVCQTILMFALMWTLLCCLSIVFFYIRTIALTSWYMFI